ncbi:uncharacterized protein LOC103510472 isoform X2 [Diaphorina citri]|uniref:Uncharacterized protein LOC103510472 isoform X2 n=1 Tax=Diaphorina citri TaxID=121845 RepID=A0A1S3D4M9_DIACI|nr:uncharacterized protein LOC103510472 isoform X2 [Diaphorina citri]XP_026680312.1 uncharacterized protein LOC103510472 isoform X2 [Diaphorina citri]XP_026680313.1 uncharacterized protein LOC103510472 isoform X2 [Diaphorina citri]XP_026680314.1 uncharacterized protein LOC103510472 isoform X2 [Diaphorina citri]XP_026680315.1 uncharacterized protein LOC103510472 isoform X2 [Diaphorina citri]XP_026680316.1 uncharacterized protein LOC103510472 isoform X2 [Diaphorina citri]
MTACIPCSSHIAPEDLDRWTDNIQNVLMADQGRMRFKQFLESRQLDEALQTLEFWERTNACVHAYERHCKNHHLTAHQKADYEASFRREAKALVDFADENINFNIHQMSLLYAALDKDASDLHNTLARTLTSASHLLDNEYVVFRKYLLKQKLTLHKKHGKLSPTSAAAAAKQTHHTPPLPTSPGKEKAKK